MVSKILSSYAEVTAPITDRLKKDVKFTWTLEAQLAFEKLKGLLTEALVLVNPDCSKSFFVSCDGAPRWH